MAGGRSIPFKAPSRFLRSLADDRPFADGRKRRNDARTVRAVLGRDRGAGADPPAAATLGLEFVDAGTIEVAFAATEGFTNPAGNLLGAVQAAMPDDTGGPALLATLEPDQFRSTLQVNVNFLRPLRPGRLVGKGRVVHRDGDLVVLGASLFGTDGAVIAAATATARVVALNRARTAA